MNVICGHRDYSKNLYKKLLKEYDFKIIDTPKKLTYEILNKINPDYVFFTDWSWIVPKKIIDNFKCICFHESDLPKFRGGSPIQNQIIRGIKITKTTAFVMTNEIDAGEILLKKKLSLDGTIDEIFKRMEENDYVIIKKIISGKFRKLKQSGKSTSYKRRSPDQSELKNLNLSKESLYDFIRMLGDPYPNAYIKIGKIKIIFKSANYKKNILSFTGLIE